MLRNFVRGFDDALSNHMCNSLVNWFESNPDVKTREVNRDTRNDKQLWLPEDSELYSPLQKVKFEMQDEYLYIDRQGRFFASFSKTLQQIKYSIVIMSTVMHAGSYRTFEM